MNNTETFQWTDEFVKEFVLTECNKHNTWDEKGLSVWFEKFKESKLPKPLFVTTDNKPIFVGDRIWYVAGDWYVGTINITNGVSIEFYGKTVKSFSTEEAAKEYVIANKPCLSINDVLKHGEATTVSIGVVPHATYYHRVNVDMIKLKEFAKSNL